MDTRKHWECMQVVMSSPGAMAQTGGLPASDRDSGVLGSPLAKRGSLWPAFFCLLFLRRHTSPPANSPILLGKFGYPPR